MSVLKMAEWYVAEPLPRFEDAEQLIADDYFNHTSDSVLLVSTWNRQKFFWKPCKALQVEWSISMNALQPQT